MAEVQRVTKRSIFGKSRRTSWFGRAKQILDRDAGKAAVLIAVLLALFLLYFRSIDRSGKNLVSQDFIFDADVERVVIDMTMAEADHTRSNVHPLFVLFFCPVGNLLVNSYSVRMTVMAQIVVSLFCSAAVVLSWFLFRRVTGETLSAWLFAAVFAFSSATWLFGSIPETYAIESALFIGMLLGYSFFFRAGTKLASFYIWCLVCAVLSYGITVAAALAPLAAFALGIFRRVSEKECAGRKKGGLFLLHSATFATLCIGAIVPLHILQHQTFALSAMGPLGHQSMRQELTTFFAPSSWMDTSQWKSVSLAFIVQNIVAPAVGLRGVGFKGANYIVLGFFDTFRSPAVWIYIILAAACLLAAARHWRELILDDIFLICTGWLAFLLVFHVAYHASNPFIYSLKATFPLLYIVAAGYRRLPRFRMAGLWVIVVIIIFNNYLFMSHVNRFLKLDLSQPIRYEQFLIPNSH